ncbi:MAG TPA: hypothetical protein VGW38_29375, partial [Chloroflexota bacterium]|nr:hypothetical protein [Chloroflexota bacterium]
MVPPDDLPAADRVAASLEACLRLPANALTVHAIAEFAPGLSAARVFRVQVRLCTPVKHHSPLLSTPGDPSAVSSFVLKVLDAGRQTLIAPQDPKGTLREAQFYACGLAAGLPIGVRAPALVGIDQGSDLHGPWLWMEDVGGALGITWQPTQALLAAERNALLHRLYLDRRAALEGLPWL